MRIDGLAGFVLSTGRLKLGLAVQPFFVPASGETRGDCRLCGERVVVESFDLNWGAAIVASMHFRVGGLVPDLR